jgi:Ca2+-binding EF-hand superfamily protein
MRTLTLVAAAALMSLAFTAAARAPRRDREFDDLGRFHPHGGLFISPAGEPFRSPEPDADMLGKWFAGADLNHDGFLSLAEMEADSERFFATLDTDRDGEIDPVELTRYEREVAPEIQLGLGLGRGFGKRRRDVEDDLTPPAPGVWGPSPGGYSGGRFRNNEREGAARFSPLNLPEPVAAADSDLNRGVSREEFRKAAGARFLLLDTDHDGRVSRAEIEALMPRLSEKEERRRRR